MEEKKYHPIRNTLVVGGLLTAAFTLGTLGILGRRETIFEKSFDPNFVDVRNISIREDDLDKNGKNESVLQYNGRNYLMKYNEKTNTVSLVPYGLEIRTNSEEK